MNSASHVFNNFPLILMDKRRDVSLLLDADIHAMRLHFCEVFVLWDGAFLLAQALNLTLIDARTLTNIILLQQWRGVKLPNVPSPPKCI
jgi:hypothetical protein